MNKKQPKMYSRLHYSKLFYIYISLKNTHCLIFFRLYIDIGLSFFYPNSHSLHNVICFLKSVLKKKQKHIKARKSLAFLVLQFSIYSTCSSSFFPLVGMMKDLIQVCLLSLWVHYGQFCKSCAIITQLTSEMSSIIVKFPER